MYYIRLFWRFIAASVVGYACITCTIIHKSVHLPQGMSHRQLTDLQANLFASKQKIRPEIGQLVMFRRLANIWAFGVVAKKLPDEYYDITSSDNGIVYKDVSLSSIKTLSSTWDKLFQPGISLDTMRRLLDGRAAYYRAHGAPDGHGMVLPVHSKIIVLGDLHGNFSSLQSHLAELYKEGLLDDQFNLKANCYVVGLGDYTGEGQEGILVMSTLLDLQEHNPNQVFLLSGDHEDVVKAQANGFQKEWYSTFGGTKKDFCLAELVWLKMLMFWKSLPKVLLVGLQMPSTQQYDFLMFCHEGFDFNWRPDEFMSRLVEKHIDQYYKNPCTLDYRDSSAAESFATVTFVDDEGVAKKRAKNALSSDRQTVWSKSAFAQFVKTYASRIDTKHMYQYCLSAIFRGHDHIPGGIVTLKGKGIKTWKALKDNKIYEIEPCSVYTCTAGSSCMSAAGCFDGAFGLIEAGPNGHWFITAHLER